jgi:hypothetical protein
MTGCYILANREHVTYRSLFQTISRIFKKSIIFIPVPVFIIQLLIHLTSLFRLPFPVNTENIQGLKKVHFMDPEDSLQKLQLNPVSLEETLQGLISQSN